jgi:hypothetical protein
MTNSDDDPILQAALAASLEVRALASLEVRAPLREVDSLGAERGIERGMPRPPHMARPALSVAPQLIDLTGTDSEDEGPRHTEAGPEDEDRSSAGFSSGEEVLPLSQRERLLARHK